MQHRAQKQLWIFIIAVILLIIISITTALFLKKRNHNQPAKSVDSIQLKKNTPPEIHQSATPWQTLIVKPGDNVETILRRNFIDPSDIKKIIALKNPHLNAIRPKQIIQIQKDNKGQLLALHYSYTPANAILITNENSHFAVKEIHQPMTTGLLYKSATIRYSLASAAKNAGLSAALFAQLKYLFKSKIDFSHNLRQGDRFTILYQEYYVDSQPYHSGNIVAAEFTNRGKTYKVIRFTYPINHTNYYTPDGLGIEPLFLPAPVNYKRISGKFTYHRLDPYLHKWHTHLGIDYAANENTPIHSIGDGRIIFIGKDAGYGNAIKVRYGQRYEALYAHMHRFAKNLKLHQYVHKNEIIGYVGETGWATGPHLHFGFYVDGIPKNWLAVKMPPGKIIPHRYARQFKLDSEKLLQTLAHYQSTPHSTRKKHHA